jgi:hypothetical protein
VAMTLPTSSGSPMRPSAVCAASGGITSGWCVNASFESRVRVDPGDTEFTRMPRVLSSLASERVRTISPPFRQA